MEELDAGEVITPGADGGFVYGAKHHGGPPSLTLSFSLTRSAEFDRNLTQYVPNA